MDDTEIKRQFELRSHQSSMTNLHLSQLTERVIKLEKAIKALVDSYTTDVRE